MVCEGGGSITMFKNIDSPNHPRVLHDGAGTIHKKVKLPPHAGKGDCVVVDCLPVVVSAPSGHCCCCRRAFAVPRVLLGWCSTPRPSLSLLLTVVVIILSWSVPILLVAITVPWC
ncbi:hypothetical protein L208DRAFT_912172 [Tricholoma matsutake]|nr:hypothetical protein L208DRAFT_912172 [Tricholoma matsutake 945]